VAKIERYLYNDFSYTIETGLKPVLVNGEVVKVKTSVPRVKWSINFGKVSAELKNNLETALFRAQDDLYFNPHIGPAFYIGKHEDLGSGAINYYLTYVFEYDYYETFVNKKIPYTIEGSNHVLSGGIVIPANMTPTDDPVIIKPTADTDRKLFYLDSNLSATHKFNSVYELKQSFYEQAAPLPYTTMFIVGAPNVNYDTSC
jgi:hypothetical protein